MPPFILFVIQFANFTVALTKTKEWAKYPYSPEIYKALLRLCKSPTAWLSRSSSSSTGLSEIQKRVCMASLGCSIRALYTLLCNHRYKRFRYITDRIPSFFTTISTLSRLGDGGGESEKGSNNSQQCHHRLLHRDLVYELYDFDRPAKSKKSKKRAANKPPT